jgi:hypothetical protein
MPADKIRETQLMPKYFYRAVALCAFAALYACGASAASEPLQPQALLDNGFHAMYELKFEAARQKFTEYMIAHPEDPLGHASLAASYLFEEFNSKGVFTSEFFLDDKKLLGGVEGPPDDKRRIAFFAANGRARDMAQQILKSNSRDPNALFVLTIADGMESDYDALIAKRQLASLRLMRQADATATQLLAIDPNAQDANLAIGAATYIIGCMPAYKRAFLWMGGIHGDRERGMNQLEQAALHGHYLQPFAKAMLALASLREKQPERARSLFAELVQEFPGNPVFARELALAEKRVARQ